MAIKVLCDWCHKEIDYIDDTSILYTEKYNPKLELIRTDVEVVFDNLDKYRDTTIMCADCYDDKERDDRSDYD